MRRHETHGRFWWLSKCNIEEQAPKQRTHNDCDWSPPYRSVIIVKKKWSFVSSIIDLKWSD